MILVVEVQTLLLHQSGHRVRVTSMTGEHQSCPLQSRQYLMNITSISRLVDLDSWVRQQYVQQLQVVLVSRDGEARPVTVLGHRVDVHLQSETGSHLLQLILLAVLDELLIEIS